MSEENELINNLQCTSSKSNEEKEKRFIKVAFLIFGIGGLLAWNAILSDLGFFEYYLSDYSPSVSFPFLNFFLNISFQFILLFTTKTISYRTQLVFMLVLSTVSILTLPACILLFKKPLYSFIAAGANILLLGFINAVCLSSFFGVASYFPLDNIIMMSTGQGIAGILMNVIQYVILLTLPVGAGDKDKSSLNRIIGTWVFFGISAVILLICCLFVILAYRTNYFKTIMIACGDAEIENQIEDLSSIDKKSTDSAPVDKSSIKEPDDKPVIKHNEKGFKYLIVKLKDLNAMIFVNYLTTFTLYPGACLSCPFFNMDMSFTANTIVCLFNVSDTIGRKIVSFFTPTKRLLMVVTFGRIAFLFTIALNAIMNNNEPVRITICSICIIVNAILFGFSNGLCTSIAYGLAPGEVEDDLKGKAGSSISFFNIVGIFGGTCAAFGMKAIIAALSLSKKKLTL